jgi:hypothetical protein
MMGEPERELGLALVYDAPCPSLTISPGPGTEGSLSCRFVITFDRRRPALDACRFRGPVLFREPGDRLAGAVRRD